jgi:hypothetical protein
MGIKFRKGDKVRISDKLVGNPHLNVLTRYQTRQCIKCDKIYRERM